MLPRKNRQIVLLKWMGIIFFLITPLIIIFFSYVISKPQTNFRTSSFLTASEIAQRAKVNDIHTLFDSYYEFYRGKVADLYANMKITLLFCIIGIVLIRRTGDIEVPAISVKIPVKIFYLIVPACLCYYWLHFGFVLHDCISSRIELVKLLQAEYLVTHNISNVNSISFQEYITLTKIVSLKDTGLLDTWFMFYYPDLFPLPDKIHTAKIIPRLVMAMFGSLYGISHGFTLGLPLNWIIRYNTQTGWPRILALTLFVVIGIFILASHLTFYFNLRNYNSVHFVILFIAILVCILITLPKVIDSYRNDPEPN
jgi:hypothetical protein